MRLPARFAALPLVSLLALGGTGAWAQNLIVNGGNESALVSGEIPGWVEVVGSNWTQRSANPEAFEGQHYFFAGAGAQGTLRQTVDLTSFAGQIDSGGFGFNFSAHVRSFSQANPDSSRIVLSFLDAGLASLGGFDSTEVISPQGWTEVLTLLQAPVGARSLQVDLVATRYAGTNNDGYFDALVLTPVPEPATAALGLLGAAGLLAWTRRRQASA